MKKKHCLVGIHDRRPKTSVTRKAWKLRARTRKAVFLTAQAGRITAARAALA